MINPYKISRIFKQYISKKWRKFSSRLRTLPTFIIGGAQKAGTSTLFYTLMKHADIKMSALKELHYFDIKYDKSLLWYKKHFPLIINPNYKHTGEASPYYLFHPLCARRISETTPNVKLIFLLRNPVDRAFSHYHHEKRHDREPLTFEQAIDRECERLRGEKEKIIQGEVQNSKKYQQYSYLARGHYVDQLKNYLEYFSRDRMLILKSEDFFESFQKTINEVFEFLNLRSQKIDELETRNTGNYSRDMSKKTRKKLKEHFEAYNKELRNCFGEKFNWNDG